MASKGDETDVIRTRERSINSLREQIQLAKQELTHHFQSYHRMLYEKEHAVLSELDAILMAAIDLHEKRRELIESEADLEEKMKRNEFHEMKNKLLQVVSIKVSEIERLVSDSEREVVELEWRDSELLTAIQESCVVSRRVKSVTPLVSLKCVGTIGSGVGELAKPRSVAIDPQNGDIFVADKDKHRIVIFDRNMKYIKYLTAEGLKWPYAVVVVADFCFVSSSRSKGLILKLNKNTGNIVAFFDPNENMFALTFDKETGMLLTCPVYTKSIWHVQSSNLEKVLEITLQTRYFLQNTTEIYDLKTHKNEIYVLFINSPYPLQSFTRDGNILKAIISQDTVSKIQYFCIDTRNNLIMSDSSADQVIVASLKGEILATTGIYSTDGADSVDILDPRGLAITRNGDVVFVCGGKKKTGQDL